MGWLGDLVPRRLRATYAPWDDFWFQPAGLGAASTSGVPVNPESAMRLSAFYACVTLLADMVATLPLILYERSGDEGERKRRAVEHPWFRPLRVRPNVWQTASEWRKVGMLDMILRGNFFNWILDGAAPPQLIRLSPERVRVVQLEDYRRGYLYRPKVGPELALSQSEVHHVMGLSFDGVLGVSVVEFARDVIGAATAQDAHAASFWRNGSQIGGVLKVKSQLTPTTRQQMRDAWHEAHAGTAKAHKIALLENGVEFEPTTLSARDSQYIENREHAVAELARFLRIPPHMIGDVDRSTSWGTGIEEQFRGFINVTLMPWLVAFEQAIGRDLLDDDPDLYAEFLVDALMRGDTLSRFQAYQIALGTSNNKPFMSINEVRSRENLDPVEDGDTVAMPPPDPTPPPLPTPGPPTPRGPADALDLRTADDIRATNGGPAGHARARVALERAVARTVDREVAAIRRQATPRHVQDVEGWRTWVDGFFARQAAYLAEMYGLPLARAQAYAREHRADLLARGLDALPDWTRDAPAALAALVAEGGDDV